VPIPWSGDEPPFGFSPPDATAQPWLRQPPSWSHLTVAAEENDGDSMLSLYRESLALRRAESALRTDAFAWLPAARGVLSFTRGDGFVSISNLSEAPVALPPGATVLLSSDSITDGRLPVDATAWVRVPDRRQLEPASEGQEDRA
jgi:alpha-glucosidase